MLGMSWAVHGLGRSYSAHGLVWAWARLCNSWAGHWLGWARAVFGIVCSVHRLELFGLGMGCRRLLRMVWAWTGPALGMVRSMHGPGWLCAVLYMGWSEHSLV